MVLWIFIKYYSGDEIKKNEADGACGAWGGGYTRAAYTVLEVKLEGNRVLGRLRCRWEEHIRVDIQET